MAFTDEQRTASDQQQIGAAQDTASQIRLLAGPGTGKSKTIGLRVKHLLQAGVGPHEVYVVTFTRATSADLKGGLVKACGAGLAAIAAEVRVSTLHALALKILADARLLNVTTAAPTILNDWEETSVFDLEFASRLSCTPTRAKEIREAYDANWQTLSARYTGQAKISDDEAKAFVAFHAERGTLYNCVLRGELIHKCVQELQSGAIQRDQLPPIRHLIVDEFQDLNACDQRFVQLLAENGSSLFVAGDDDQSIYTLRHANPQGIVNFVASYPKATTHVLDTCFRCTPAILGPATKLIEVNAQRFPKPLHSAYRQSAPPVLGLVHVWSFETVAREAAAIAQSCTQLIAAGMRKEEDEIVILIKGRSQLAPLEKALEEAGVPFDLPRGANLIKEFDSIRAVYAALRIARDLNSGRHDYMAVRDLLGTMHQVGPATARGIADACVQNNHNFRDLFLNADLPPWLTESQPTAVRRVRDCVSIVGKWQMNDNLEERHGDIAKMLEICRLSEPKRAEAHPDRWIELAERLPKECQLGELLDYLDADSESSQQSILDRIRNRIGVEVKADEPSKRVRILTMHGAKGLSGKVVFIPGASTGILPSPRALNVPGFMIEERRLFYVSLTRARACCIVSHHAMLEGRAAFAIAKKQKVKTSRSRFVTEMGATSVGRDSGLTRAEADQILAEIGNL